MEKLMIINPEILKFQQKFIQWKDFDDNIVFLKMLAENIYINGFVNDKFIHLKLYNKLFFSEETVKSAENACLITRLPLRGDDKGNCLQAFVLNPILVSQEIMIYGCGENGRIAVKYLEKYYKKPKGFIDSDPGKCGKEIYGYKIFSPDIISHLPKNTIIILAADQYQAMEDTVRSYSSDMKMLHFEGYVTQKCGDSINGVALNVTLEQLLCNKRIYLYGSGDKLREYVNFFRLLDLPPKGILVDFDIQYPNEFADLEIKPVEEILYEDSFCVIVCSENEASAIHKLESLGLNAANNFILSSGLRPDRYELRKTALDINLGYTYISRSGDYGVSKIIASKEEKYKIAILGGSTTDGELYAFKSWPEYLKERINKNNISIYNYGVAGYGAGQEMLRLIRDILPQKPDLILAYNGYNDFCEYSYAGFRNLLNFKYLASVMQFAGNHLKDSYGNDKQVYCGEETFSDNFSRWLTAVKIMYKLADLYHIPFIDFLQPMLCDKPNKSKEERLLCNFDVPYRITARGFRESFASLSDKQEYLVDLSDIFDDTYNIYMDICHVTEKGNKIIADKIYQIIEPIIYAW